MHKRGQVTLFVLIGLVILFALALYLYARGEYGFTVPPSQYLSSQATPITTNIDQCITQDFEPGARLLGEQGGSFTPAQSAAALQRLN